MFNWKNMMTLETYRSFMWTCMVIVETPIEPRIMYSTTIPEPLVRTPVIRDNISAVPLIITMDPNFIAS